MAEMMKDDEAPTTPTRDDRIPLPPPGAVPPSFVEQDFGVPPPLAQTLGDLQHEGGLETGEQKEKTEGGEEDEMIRLRRAAAAQRESLPLLHPTPDINAGPPSYTPPATTSSNPPSSSLLTSGSTDTDASSTPSSSTPFSNSLTALSSRKGDAVRPPPPVERIPSSTSDDFGEFVDAPPSAAVPALEGGMDPLTPDYVGAHDDPLQFTSLQDPLQPTTVQDPLSSLNHDVSAQRPPPPPLDPLSLPSQPQPQPHAQSHPRAPWSASPSSSPLLPPTPSLGSPAPPPPPKSARPPTNLVDEVLLYEEGGLSLFSDPFFSDSSSSSESAPPPPAPPPKPPTPILPNREWNSRTATPTPSSATGIAYAGGMLSPTPLHPPTLTPPTTAAAHPSGAFRDHPLAPTPGSRPRTPPKVTTPHLGPASLSAASSASSSSTKSGKKGKGQPMGVEEKLKHATSPHAETEIIAHHLGLIDDDYFSSREPADASALAIPAPRELSRSRSRSEKGGGLVGSLGGLLSGGGGVGAGGAGGAGVARGREGRGGETAGGEAGREGVSRGREPSPVQTRAAPPVMTSGAEWDWEDDSAHGHHHPPPSSPRRTSSSSSSATLGGLWGLWKGASPSPHGPGLEEHGQQHGLSASPQPVPPTIVEGQPATFDFGDRSSNSSVERQGEDEYGSVGVQGRSGRPLPKARTSLESIQQRWMDHGGRPPSHHAQGYSPITTSSSSSPAGHRDLGGLGVPTSSRGKSRTPSPSRTRKDNVRIDPPTITHVSPFAPPPPPPNSAIFASSGLNAGFGDPMAVAGGLLSSSISSSTSSLGLGRGSGGLLGALAGAGGSASANPFGSHTFVPIAGAPGFRPEGYDWDKGYSEELERELSVASPPQTATPTRESFGATLETRGEGKGVESGVEKRYADEKTYGVRERGRQPRNQQEKEPSIYQTIGSKFGLWGSSSSSSTPSSSSTSSSSSAFNTVPTSREKEFGGYNGHGRSATTPSYSYSSAGQGKWGDGGGGERRVINGKKVGELIERKVGCVELKARKESTVGVLGRGVGDKLRPHLPPLSRLPRTWTLLYSMDQHGISLNTLYTLCEAPEKNRRPTQPYVGMGGHILVIRDDASETDKESCFGAYIADGLSRSKAKGFYGGGDSFLFKYHAPSDTLSVFHPTGRNTYYALCESGYMAFGGGNGGSGYALWVSEDLLEGSSASGGPGGTFGNEVLCFGGTRKRGKEGQEVEVELEVVGLEVWGVGPT